MVLINGTNYIEEVKLLLDLSLNFEQLSHVEKLLILANKNFSGLTKLHNEFDLISSEFLNDYYLRKNKNNFMRYFLNIVTIQPNINGSFKDKNIQSLSTAKQELLDNNLEESINQLASINGADNFFEIWIVQAKYYIEVNNLLKKI